jgi:hypothetical protein
MRRHFYGPKSTTLKSDKKFTIFCYRRPVRPRILPLSKGRNLHLSPKPKATPSFFSQTTNPKKSMKTLPRKLRALALAAGTLAVTASGAKAAQAGVYAANDLLMFFQNPAGTTGTDQLAYFNLGSTYNVFRDAATPSSGAFSSTISLGNINSILTSTYGADWTSLSSSIFVAANGQNGSTSITATSTQNGDYARTVYITKPRTSAGSAGQANSASPLYAPSQTAVAGQIDGANNMSGITQPGATNDSDTLLDGYNPFFNGNPATAYGAINGGLMGSITSSSYTFGSISNIVGALDLYRVAKTSGTGTANANIWQNANNIAATYSNDFGVGGGGSASAYYLGTITLSDNGDVNFAAVPEPSTYALLALAAAGLGAHVIRLRKRQS